MLRVICAVESIRVPSQSKTIRSNCCRAMRVRLALRLLVTLFGELIDEAPAVGRQGRLELQRLACGGMREPEPVSMQEHPLQARVGIRARQRLVQAKIAVFGIADDRQTQMRQVNPDLMGAPGLEFGLEERIVGPDRKSTRLNSSHMSI